jgi:glycosyltransferase involved in cell wall biosynthesis
MKDINLSVVLATYNEESSLGRCLESVREIADEIIIVDGQSGDKTVDIAKKFNARIISTTNKPNFHINKNMAIDAARGNWILQLDADEVVTPQLAVEIKKIIGSDSQKRAAANGYWINRRNWFLDRFLTKGGQYPDPTLRLYRRGKGRLPARDVHEQAQVSGPTGRLVNDLLHYRDTDFAKYLGGFNRYTGFIAGQMAGKKLPLDALRTVDYLTIKPCVTFCSLYFRHRGYVDGFPGLVFALFSGLVHPVSYIKYWQETKYPA